jgi:hypothetical protein
MVYVDGEKRGEMAGEMVYVDGEKRGEMAGEMVWEESYCAVHFIAPERKMNRRRRAEESPEGRGIAGAARLPCASKKRGGGA